YAYAEGSTSIAQRIEFVDEYKAPPKEWEPEYQGKAWSQSEKKKLLEYLAFIQEKAPGVVERATANRKILFFRGAKVEKSNPWKLMAANSVLNSIVVTDQVSGIVSETAAKRFNIEVSRNLTHELIHLAEPMHRISRSKDWRRLIEPRLDQIQVRFFAKTGQNVWECIISLKKAREFNQLLNSIALEEGLPSSYAAFNPTEALAECASFMIFSSSYSPPEKIKDFIKVNLLSSPNQPDLPSKLAHEGVGLFLAGKIDDSILALDKVQNLEPTWAEIYLRRAVS